MDIQKTANEIGLFETAINLACVCSSSDVINKVGAAMPLPDNNINNRVKEIAKWLLESEKSKYLFLSPEIALIEEMGKLCGGKMEAIIAIPSNLEKESRERLRNNLPHSATVSLLEEPFFPQSFFPSNGIIIICGYSACDRAMALSDTTYRMLESYSGFWGKKVFVPFTELSSATRLKGWREINPQRIDEKWRCLS